MGWRKSGVGKRVVGVRVRCASGWVVWSGSARGKMQLNHRAARPSRRVGRAKTPKQLQA